MFSMVPVSTLPAPVLTQDSCEAHAQPAGQEGAAAVAPEGPQSPDASRLADRPPASTDPRGPTAGTSWRAGPVVLDTLTRQVDQQRRRTFARFDALGVQIRRAVLSETLMAAESRLSVVNEVLSEVASGSAPAGSMRCVLLVLQTAERLLDQLELILKGRHLVKLENIRRSCLRAAEYSRLVPLLDPDFLQRVVDGDLQPVDEARAVDVALGRNPFRCFQPQFSCWKHAPVPPALPSWEEAPCRISMEMVLEVWSQWTTELGVCLPPKAIEALSYAPGAGEADVQAILSEWMKLPDKHAEVLMMSGSRIVAVRVGTRAAERVFAGRAPHELARYCPYTRTLVIGVKVTDGVDPAPDGPEVPDGPDVLDGQHGQHGQHGQGGHTRQGSQDVPRRFEIPSNHRPFADGRPSRFWLEMGRMVVRGAWNEAATTVLEPAVHGAGASREDRCQTECMLELPQDSFLEALSVDAEAGPLGFPLGDSEEETHARVVGLHLCGADLPVVLQHYVERRLGQTPGPGPMAPPSSPDLSPDLSPAP